MTTQEKIIKNKSGQLELAKMLGNVSKACKVMGYLDCFFLVPCHRNDGNSFIQSVIARNEDTRATKCSESSETFKSN